MPYRYYLPDGSSVSVPDNIPIGVAEEKARERFPDRFKTQPTAEEGPSGKSAFLHGAERGVIPGLAGFVAGRAAGALASWALGPQVGIPVTIASLVGGLGTGMGASVAQEKALEHIPETAKALGQDVETQQAEQKTHPYYGAAGEGLASLLGMKFNLGLLGNAATRNQALLKMAGNAAIGAGIDTGFQLYNGQPYDPIQALIAASVGGLGTEENPIGRRAAALGEAPINLMRGRKAFPESVAPVKPPLPKEETQETSVESERQVRNPPQEDKKVEGVDIGALLSGSSERPRLAPSAAAPRIEPTIETTEPPPGYGEELPPPPDDAQRRYDEAMRSSNREFDLSPPSETAEATAPPEAPTPPETAKPTPTFDKLPTYSPEQKTMTYAGIGSRSAPPKVLGEMNAIARKLSDMGYTLRSGGAKGSDSAFESGAGDKKEIYSSTDATDLTRTIAKEIHPAPDKLNPTVLNLMARNTNQIFGENLNTPADFVLTYTPDGAESSAERSMSTGGTGQAIDMASRKGVPVINMAKEGWQSRLVDVLSGKEKPPVAAQRPNTAPRGTSPVAGESVLPTQEGWAAHNKEVADKQAEAAQRAEEASKVRLDTPEYPAALEKDHDAALQALAEGKFVVRETFKKFRGRPADSVFHVVDSLDQANLLVEQLNDKTAEKPTDVRVIPPSEFIAAKKAYDDELTAYRDRLDRKPGEDYKLLKRAGRDPTVTKKAAELISNPDTLALLNNPKLSARVEQFLGEVGRNPVTEARVEKLTDPELVDAVKRIEERKAQIEAEQKAAENDEEGGKSALYWKNDPTDKGRSGFMEIPPESGGTGRPVQFVPDMNVRAREGAYEGVTSLEDLPESVAKRIEARRAAEAEGRAESARMAAASAGREYKPIKPTTEPGTHIPDTRSERFHEDPEYPDVHHATLTQEERLEQQAREPKHDVDSLLAALKKTFGIHTQRLLDSGFLNIISDRSALPEGLSAGPHTRGLYWPPENKVYLMAGAIPRETLENQYNLKGLLLHEIGIHAGMKHMLGKNLFHKLIKEVEDRAAKGEKPFVAADTAVRLRNVPAEHEGEERLAYMVSKYKDLPFVKRIYTQIRQWLWRKMGGKFLTLSDEDIGAMAAASLRRVARMADTGNIGDIARKGGAFSESAPDFEEPVILPRSDTERLAEEHAQMTKDEEKKINRGTLKAKLKEWAEGAKDRPYEQLVRQFQDTRRVMRQHGEGERAAGRLKEHEPTLAELADLNPSSLFKSEANVAVKRVVDAVDNYRRKTGESYASVLAEIKRHMLGLTEQDLRKYLYARFVPMDETPHMFPGQAEPISPAALREALVKAQETTKDLTSPDAKQKYGYDAKSLRDYVDYLAQNFAKRDGFVPEHAPPSVHMFKPDANITKIEHPAYDLIGDVTREQAIRWRDDFYKKLAGKNGKELQEVIDSEKALRNTVKEVEKKNGYWGQHVDNAIAFQNREHYYSLKGQMANYSLESVAGSRLRGDMSKNQVELGGRTTMADNPATQTIADMNTAMGRYDKKGFLDELFRQGKWGLLKDTEHRRILKELDPITVGNRRNYELPPDVNPSSVILRPNEAGGYDVMQVMNKDWLEAIKGIVQIQSLPLNALGKATRFISAGITRYNPGFAPINGIRHLNTNLGNIAAEFGFGTAAKTATRFASQLAMGSPFKAAYAAHLFATGNDARLNQLAEKDSFFRNLRDWGLTEGGKITWNMAYSNETATKYVVGELKRNGMKAKSKAALDYVADIWNNMFEFMNREAAFDSLKKKFIADGADPAKVNTRAAAVTKNLLNLELAGRDSKAMSSWFALFKAEATGAVRQTDAILTPLFKSTDEWIRDTYGSKNQRDNDAAIEHVLPNKEAREKAVAYWNQRRRDAYLLTVAAMGFGYVAHKLARAVSEKNDDDSNMVGTDDKAQWVRNLRIPTTILGPLKDSLGANNKFINIPWGFGTGAFASIGAQMSMLEEGDVKPVEAAQHMISAAKQSFMPVPLEDWGLFNHNPAGWAIASAAPTVLKPILYYAWNADSFGRQIYNTHAGKYGEAYAGGDYTPEMFKGLSKRLSDATDGAVDISPHLLQHYANNYVQGISNVTQAIVGNYQNLMGDKEFDAKTDLPFFSSLVGRQTDADAREFSDTEAYLKKAKERLSALKNTDRDEAYDRYVDAHPDIEGLVKSYDKAKSQINKINQQLNAVRASDQTPKESSEERNDLRHIRSSIMKDLNDDFEEASKTR